MVLYLFFSVSFMLSVISIIVVVDSVEVHLSLKEQHIWGGKVLFSFIQTNTFTVHIQGC